MNSHMWDSVFVHDVPEFHVYSLQTMQLSLGPYKRHPNRGQNAVGALPDMPAKIGQKQLTSL